MTDLIPLGLPRAQVVPSLHKQVWEGVVRRLVFVSFGGNGGGTGSAQVRNAAGFMLLDPDFVHLRTLLVTASTSSECDRTSTWW